jgi:hypothetical protein
MTLFIGFLPCTDFSKKKTPLYYTCIAYSQTKTIYIIVKTLCTAQTTENNLHLLQPAHETGL